MTNPVQTKRGRVPVLVVTGFLGSGKTTFVNALLRHPRLQRTAVIVNEFGEVGVDNLLVAGAVDNILLLEGGCLCCGMLGTLRETLLDLYGRQSAGEIPPFERVLVETSGLADPAPILQTLLRDSLVGPYFALDGLVALVDALLGEAELEQHREAVQQVAMADRLLVTKTDLTNNRCPPALAARLRGLNVTAPIETAQFGVVDPTYVFGCNEVCADTLKAARAEAMAGHEPSHPSKVRTEAFVIDRAVSWAGLAAWTDAVREFFGEKLLRCKGVLSVTGVAGPVVVQGVQKVFTTPLVLERWPNAERRSVLVCISMNLDTEMLRATLKLLHAEPGTYRPSSLDDLLTNAASDWG